MQPISRVAPQLSGRVLLRQRWSDLVFLHWRIDAAEVQPLLPPGIVPDVFDGSSWVGLIPFRMSETAPLAGPVVPYFGSFTEVNVRLYAVDRTGRRGVVFASLEASRLAAVLAARTVFGLPYFWARASARRDGDLLRYDSRRFGRGGPSTHVVARTTDRERSDDALADFLTARWAPVPPAGERCGGDAEPPRVLAAFRRRTCGAAGRIARRIRSAVSHRPPAGLRAVLPGSAHGLRSTATPRLISVLSATPSAGLTPRRTADGLRTGHRWRISCPYPT